MHRDRRSVVGSDNYVRRENLNQHKRASNRPAKNAHINSYALGRQRGIEHRASNRLGFHPNPATVLSHKPLYRCEADAGAGAFKFAPAVKPLKWPNGLAA
jgi:hypothetical protein